MHDEQIIGYTYFIGTGNGPNFYKNKLYAVTKLSSLTESIAVVNEYGFIADYILSEFKYPIIDIEDYKKTIHGPIKI